MEDEEEFARFVLKVLRLMITHEQRPGGWWIVLEKFPSEGS